MTAAWAAIGLLVLAVPVLAFWLGGRRFWGRMESRASGDPAAEVMRRHGLTSREAAAVVSAVTQGQALEDPRQRAAAVELAELTHAQLFPPWEEASAWRRTGLVLTGVWGLLVVGAAVFTAVLHGLGEVAWWNLILVGLLLGGPAAERRRLRRTIALNSNAGPRT